MGGNNSTNKRPVEQTWTRSGGKRLRRSESPTPSYTELQDELIVQDYVASRNACFGGSDTKQHQTSAVFKLPEEIKLIIFDLLPYPDIITMARTCQSMAEFVNRNYVPSLILPLSPQNLKKLDGRDVLCLKSDFNVVALEKLKKGEYLKNLAKIELSNLQKLVFVLYEHSGANTFPCDHILPPLYKDILNHYLSFAKQLTYLHISIDRSEETFDIIDLIVDGLPCLSKIVLQATNTPNNVIYPIEGEVSQETKARAAELQVLRDPPELLTLNELLEQLLEKPSLRSLEILDLSLTQNWDPDYRIGQLYQLDIASKTLTHLKIVQDAFFYIDRIECPELVEFEYIDLGADNFEWLECLIHHDAFNGDYKKLTSGCPKLERLNDIDINSLRNRLTSQPGDIVEWDDLLKSVCNCKFEEEEEYSDV